MGRAWIALGYLVILYFHERAAENLHAFTMKKDSHE